VPLFIHPSAFPPRLIQRPDVTLPYFNQQLTQADSKRPVRPSCR
jgi:7,8-dihydropterin-6-yl-methyl-4-(beta-D-ribofuranosyl)aminobenzene 5'-phosphate synthase